MWAVEPKPFEDAVPLELSVRIDFDVLTGLRESCEHLPIVERAQGGNGGAIDLCIPEHAAERTVDDAVDGGGREATPEGLL